MNHFAKDPPNRIGCEVAQTARDLLSTGVETNTLKRLQTQNAHNKRSATMTRENHQSSRCPCRRLRRLLSVDLCLWDEATRADFSLCSLNIKPQRIGAAMTRYAKYYKKFNQSANFSSPAQQPTNEAGSAESTSLNSKQGSKFCFCCRQTGHVAKNCKSQQEGTDAVAHGTCYICGATGHTSKICREASAKKGTQSSGSLYKFATCFVCSAVGHISAECPQNDRGMYPNGGSCKFCGSVRHLAKDCKPLQKGVPADGSVVGTTSNQDASVSGDVDDALLVASQMHKTKAKEKASKSNKTNKVVKF